MLVALTGTPGTGKTTVAEELRRRGYEVLDLSAHIRSSGLLGNLDESRDTYEVDLDLLNDSLEPYRKKSGTVITEGHLSHFMDCGTIIVLRCAPGVLAERLERRGYSRAKVRENTESEILDVILCESAETDIPVFEIDCTSVTPAGAADAVEDILSGNTGKYLPGSVNWSSEMEEWFLTDRERERILRCRP